MKAPVDVAARRAVISGTEKVSDRCAQSPQPMRDIVVGGFYTDLASSVIDPNALAWKEQALKPLNAFTAAVTMRSDRLIASRDGAPDAARCALDWLTAWADAGAMLGTVSHQGAYEREWRLAGLALAWLKLRQAPGLDHDKSARVVAWLGALADAVGPPYNAPPKGRIPSSRNNHAYWAGLAVAAAGIATDDRARFEWGISRYHMGIADIAADGTLPLELARKKRALHYHLFALLPLVMLAELGEANGLPLYRANNGALSRLVDTTITGLDDPAIFVRLTGEAQDVSAATLGGLAGGKGFDAAWLEPYYARMRDPSALPLLKRLRPLNCAWLGGNMTLDFGVPTLP
ncbi:MAG: alginate lyase family protein [Alphaproteobacteria bacterium]|nr:alginate lyase family protein [Alphaproteobacteria bacterium]